MYSFLLCKLDAAKKTEGTTTFCTFANNERSKVHFLNIIIKTLAGLEECLASEVRAIGGQNVRVMRRAVACEGDERFVYRANYELRTALRVLVTLFTFNARDEDDLYRQALRLPWQKQFTVDHSFAIDCTAYSQIFTHSHYASLKLKDAIADAFRRTDGRRPDVNVDFPSVRFHLYITGKRCVVSLDSSGRSLHLRGYRTTQLDAPLNEVLAAGLVKLSGWQPKQPFIDPMCGSGTLSIEAAMLAQGRPPQVSPNSLAFLRWPHFNKALWESVLREAEARISNPALTIYAADKSPRAIKATQQNALNAGLEAAIQLEKRRLADWSDPPQPAGTLILNPPYDERMSVENIHAFYAEIGDAFKQLFPGYTAWIISSHLEALKHIGLRASHKTTLFNGALECRWLGYELYEGSRS